VKLIRLGAGAAVLALTLSVPALAATTNQATVDNGIGYLASQQQASGAVAGSPGTTAWAVRAYAAAHLNPGTIKAAGGQSLTDYLAAHTAEPAFGSATVSDWERDALAVLDAGLNPAGFGGHDYLAAIKGFAANHQLGSDTLVSDDYFGVVALARAGATGSELSDSLAFVLAHQHVDGGFGWSADATATSDVDDTAAALMALAAAKQAGLAVSASSITDARAYLLAHQNPDGGFMSDPAYNTSSSVGSTSWALLALAALGEGNSAPATAAQGYLRTTQQSDGAYLGFTQTDDTYNTANAVLALATTAGITAGQGQGSTVPSASPSTTPTATPSTSPAPSSSPRVTASPTTIAPAPSGSVLGASTVNTGSVLPSVGQRAGAVLLTIAFALALTGATLVYLRSRAARR
jgi:hypothetical protein